MQENEAKPHNYQTDIEELSKSAEVTQIQEEIVATQEESNRSLGDAIKDNTRAVVNLTKSIKGGDKKEDTSAEDVVESVLNNQSVGTEQDLQTASGAKEKAEKIYSDIASSKGGFNPFSASSLFSGWGSLSEKEKRKNADSFWRSYYENPQTRKDKESEKESRGFVRVILSGIWGSVKGVTKVIKGLSTFVANSIFHPIETAKWIASALGSLLTPLAPVAATALGIGGAVAIGTEILTTRKNREGFLERRGAVKQEDGTYNLSGMSVYDRETAMGLLDEKGRLKSADKVDWGTSFRVASANFSDTFLTSVKSFVSDNLAPWGYTLGSNIAHAVGDVLGHVLYQYGDYLAEILPFVDSYAEKLEKASSEVVKNINTRFFKQHGKDKDQSGDLKHWGAAMKFDDGRITSYRTRSGVVKQSDDFKDAMVDAAFSVAELNKSLPRNHGVYVSSDMVGEDGKPLSAVELFRTSEEFKKWKDAALKEDKNGMIDITSLERSRMVELFNDFVEKKKSEQKLVKFDQVPDVSASQVSSDRSAQTKESVQPKQPEQNNTTNNNVNQYYSVSYSTNLEVDAAWRAVLQ